MAMVIAPIAFLNAEEHDRAVYRISATGGALKGEALINQAAWLDDKGKQCEETTVLDANADYLVGYKNPDKGTVYSKAIRTSDSSDVVFSGRSLTIGDDSWSKGDGVLYVSRKNYKTSFSNEGLFLRFGRIALLKDSNAEFNIYGKVTILADGTDKRTFNIGSGKDVSGQTVNFHGSLIGGESAEFGLAGLFTDGPVTARFYDAAGYSGTVICREECELAMSGDSGAKVMVETNGTISAASATEDWSLANLSLETNTVIRVTTAKSTDANGVEYITSSTIHVKNELQIKGIASVQLSMSDISFDGRTNRFVVLTAPKSASLNIKNFILDLDMGAYPDDMRRLAKLQVESGDDRDFLVFVFEPVVSLVTGDNNKQTNCSEANSSFADGKEDHWSDGKLPHEGVHYVVLKSNSGSIRYLNTTGVGRTAATAGFEIRHFPGESLTIGPECVLTLYQPLFKVKELRLLDGSKVRLGQFAGRLQDNTAVDVKISGEKVVMPSGRVTMLSYTGYVMEFSGDLSGAALVEIPGIGGTSSPDATTRFIGNNDSFAGKFLVSQCDYNKGPPTLSVLQTLNVSETNQLGGIIPEMAWDGVCLKRMGRILVSGNAALATGTNRGLYIDSTSDVENTPFYGLIKILSGKEFAVETQLTMNGVLRKDGSGTLTLAAPVKFGEGAASDEPFANSNVLHVVEGNLKVRSAGGIDGLMVKFGNSAGFVIDASASAADFVRYGAKNIKTDTPFVLPDGATKLPLEIIYPSIIPEEGVVMGVLTVRTSIAESVKAMLPDMPRRIDGKIVRKIEIVDSINRWTTFALEIGVRHGTQVIVR